jgi:cell division septation protein DedD
MENENYQKELFEFETPKKAAAKFGSVFQRNDLVILTAERMVFAAIGMLMLMVVFFALGVEKGKADGYAAARASMTASDRIVVSPIVPVKTAAVSVVKPKPIAAITNITPKISPQPAVSKKPSAALDRGKPYTIVAASFSREDFALREVNRLKADGLEAFIHYGEAYYLACVGSFENKRDAEKILNKVKRVRRDAYVRLR